MNYYHFLFCILLSFAMQAQDFSKETLQKMDDEELLSLFNEIDTDSIIAEKVARTYLNRAKKEKDTIKMARGYDRLARIFSYQKNLQFADSIIFLTKDLNHKTYPALGYLLKGFQYSRKGDLELEVSNYLIAYDIAVKNKNITQELFLLNTLLYSKAIWGNKKDALRLQIKRHKLLNTKSYYNNVIEATRKGANYNINEIYLLDELSSIQNFVFCYLNLKVLDSAEMYLKKGLILSKNNNHNKDIQYIYNWFLESSVEIDYYAKRYQKAISTCDTLLSILDVNKNIRSLQNVYLFKGLSLIDLDKYENGIYYLKRSDSIFEVNNFSVNQPYQRVLFVKLLEYHNLNNITKQKIKYLNKLITVDSILIRNYKYFDPSFIKNMETPQLIREKEILIASLKQKNKTKSTTIWWVLGLLGVTLVVLSHYIKRQLVFKKRFNILISQKEASATGVVEKQSKSEISKEIINDILEHLDCFEQEKKYLSQKITLQHMAKNFGTNYNYLSKVINLNKGKRFSNYINDLRSNYAFYELKENTKFRKYTIKAIAKECGFKSAESFSKSFYKNFGIYPSFYLKQLEKESK